MFGKKNPRCIATTGVCIYYYLSIFRIIVRFEIFVRSPCLVARLTNRTSRPRRHQDGAASATETFRSIFADNRATASFVPTTREVFASHRGFSWFLPSPIILLGFRLRSTTKVICHTKVTKALGTVYALRELRESGTPNSATIELVINHC